MLSREELDRATFHGCSAKDCEHDAATIYLQADCHPSGKIEVSYRHGSGVLRIGCKECGRLITKVKVAE